LIQFVKDCNNLRLLVYLIGYPDKGESQVVLVIDNSDGSVLMSGVIDCYAYQNVNRTIDVLTAHNVKTLDFFCWTHTDDDHSVGTSDIIDKFCSKHTQFFLPEGIYGETDDFTSYSAHIQTAIDKINAFNQRQNYNVSTITVAEKSTMHLDGIERTFTDAGRQSLVFRILALAPNSAIIRRRMKAGLHVKNDTSIALKIHFGNFSGFLGGDIENQTISQIMPHHFARLSYIKTPHHTSTSSDLLLDKIDEVFVAGDDLPIACSTVYITNGLPDVALVTRYKGYAKQFATTGDASKGHLYGTIKVEYDDNSLVSTIDLQGNADMLF
jgi:beta-lactamase superfamily II metal-dependent hydrolase